MYSNPGVWGVETPDETGERGVCVWRLIERCNDMWG